MRRGTVRRELQPRCRGSHLMPHIMSAVLGTGRDSAQPAEGFDVPAPHCSAALPASAQPGRPRPEGCARQLQGCWRGPAPSPGPSTSGAPGAGSNGAGAAEGEGRRSGRSQEEPCLPRGRLGHAPGMSPSTRHRQLPTTAPRDPTAITGWLQESMWESASCSWCGLRDLCATPWGFPASPGAMKWAREGMWSPLTPC